MNLASIKYKEIEEDNEISEELKNIITDDTIIVCIGTNKVIGDCLGPLVGTLLKYSNFPLPVYGTINNPIHALNLSKKLEEIKNEHPNSKIIAVDACLGEYSTVGDIFLRNIPISPGKGAGKILPEVGDYSIIGIVSYNYNLGDVNMSFIMNMAVTIAQSIDSNLNSLNSEIKKILS